MPHIVLVNAPFGNVRSPHLGIGLLTAQCRRLGLPTEAHYANLQFAARIGIELYKRFAQRRDSEVLIGEAVFAAHAYDGLPPPEPVLFDKPPDHCATYLFYSPVKEEDFRRARRVAGAFLDDTVRTILALDPRIVGFTSLFHQTLCSLALARRIKQSRPEIVTVLGGPSASLPMGRAIADVAPWVDFVFSGEADVAFPALCRDLLAGSMPAVPRVVDCGAFQGLQSSPPPDYDDYFRQLRPLQQAGRLPSTLPTSLLFESSRGCWWGQKKPCRFCGFCAAWRTYRQKSAARVLEEIFYLWERYGIGSLDATDNAMPPKYFKDVLPAVARRRKPDQFLFYEIRPTTTPAQVAQLAKAGFLLAQPGIESLVTPVLKKMGKGTSAPQNIVLLRECRARRISACWNFLFGIPGEKRRDYEMLCDALPALFHLEAPQSFGPVRLDRYSEYFERPVRYGFRNLRPLPILRSLFPPHADFREIFAVLEKDWNTELLDDQPLFDRLKGLFLQWHDLWRSKGSPPALEALPTPSGRMVIHDTRPCAVETAFVADAQAAAVLKRLNKPVRVRDARCLPKDVLQELLRRRFVLKYEGRLLTLVTRASRGPAC